MEVQRDKRVTVCLTSTGRWDLLRRTIESFSLYNTYSIHRFHIHDDSGLPIPDGLKKDFKFIEWTRPAETIIRNQIRSIDYLWWCCDTEYVFFGEDDWEFSASGFIEASMAILEVEPKIMQVWLQPLEQHNAHPIDWSYNLFEPGMVNGVQYGLMQGGANYAAIRFNPSLKRKSDYDIIAPFSKHTTWNAEKPWKCEADIAKVYSNLGFKAAILPGRYITHIGENRHVGPTQ